MSTKINWTDAMTIALLEYWDSHLPKFEDQDKRNNQEKRKIWLQAAAAHVTNVCTTPAVSSRQADDKFRRLHRDYAKPGVKWDEFISSGSSTFTQELFDRIRWSKELTTSISEPTLPIQPDHIELTNNCDKGVTTNRNLEQLELILCQKEREIEAPKSVVMQSDKKIESLMVLFHPHELRENSLISGGLSDLQICELMTSLVSQLRDIVFDSRERDIFKFVTLSLHDIERGNKRLNELVKAILLVEEHTSFSVASSQREYQQPTTEALFGATIGAATLRWIFQSAFPSFQTGKSAWTHMSESIIEERVGPIALRNFRSVVFKSFIEKSSFQTVDVPNEAAELTSKMHDALSHLLGSRLTHLYEGGSPGIKYTSFWTAILRRISRLFKDSLSLFARLQLNVRDDLDFFWPAPNERFDGERMQMFEPAETHREAMRIKHTLFPGLMAYDSADFQKYTNPETRIASDTRGEAGQVLSKALVLV